MNIYSGHASSDQGLRCLFIDMNSFFASCEQQAQPHLRGQPVAVAPVMTDTTCAIAASYEAKKFGIKTGTPIWEARRLCRDLHIVQARPALYVDYHQKILQAIDACLPVESIVSIDEMACRLDKTQRHVEAARQLGLSVKQSIRQRVGEKLISSIGIAPNRLLAKLASDMQKPDGLVILRPDDLPAAILHLRPQDITGIGVHMQQRLQRAGIRTMQQLWAADGQRLRRIWGGIGGLRFHALLHGADLASPARAKRSMAHQHVLAPAERSLTKATPIIRQLLTRVAQRLREEGFYCRRLAIDIKWSRDLGSYGNESSFHETQDTAFLLKILRLLWERVPEGSPLRVGVTLSGLAPCAAHQPDLFSVTRPAQLTQAVDLLNKKFGRGMVGYGTAMPPMTSKIAFTRVPKASEFD